MLFLRLIFSTFFILASYTAIAKDVIWPAQIEQIDLNQKASGWLQSHEDAGGHTIERHVDKSDSYLKKRVSSGNIMEASSFVSLSAAEQIIAMGLWQNIDELSLWMKNPNGADRMVIEAHDPIIIGKGIRKNEQKISPRYGVRIVLQKTKNKKSAFILTAYPNKRRP